MMKKLFLLPCLVSLAILSKAQWIELGGSNVLAANSTIRSICGDTSGNIYAAGYFTNSSNQSFGKEYVAKWNGSGWSELGGFNVLAANSQIVSLCTDSSGNIYAAGNFSTSTLRRYVAKWNKATNIWSELGGTNALAANFSISSVCSDALGNIYAAGDFTNSNGKRYVAKWNKATNLWSELSGTNTLAANWTIYSICSDASGNIYAAGDFTNVVDPFSGQKYVAKWNGSSWSELGGTNALAANGAIYSICSDALGNIYAAGNIKNTNGKFYVAKWNGSSWNELGGTDALAANNTIQSLCSDAAGNIYAAGWFTNSSSKQYVAKWNGNNWSELGGTNTLAANNGIYSVCSDASGNMYAAGLFTNSSSKQYVAKYTIPCVPNIWTGNVNTDWNNSANWSCNILPAVGSNVIIPFTTNQPVLNSAKIVANLNLEAAFNLNGQTLTINGAVSGNGTISGSPTSNIIINGNAGNLKFTNGAAILHSLILNTGGAVSVSNNLLITGPY